MEKFKKFVNEHKVFFTILLVAISLLGLEYILVNNYVDKKTNPKKNEISNKASNVSQLKKDEKELLGINNISNLSSNSELAKDEVTADKKISNKNNEKKQELSNSNVNKKYLEYEELTDEEKKKVEVIPSKEKVDISELDKTNSDDVIEVPTKFNLEDKIQLNYKDQGGYGLCWNFSSTKVAETFMALNYNKQYNFSEIAIDYLTSEYMYDKMHSLHSGGYSDGYYDTVNILNGLIESKYMNSDYYHNYTKEEYANILSLPRVSLGSYEYVSFPTLISKDGKIYDLSDNEVTDEDLAKYRENIKKHIMTNSAIGINVETSSISDDVEVADKPEGEYANIPRERAYYCSAEECKEPNHAVTVIGWDDNFDRRVFKRVDSEGKTYIPKNNGAFIIVNSWSNKKDLYYISYEDIQIYQDTFGIRKVDVMDETKYLNVSTLNKSIQDAMYKKLSTISFVTVNGVDYISYDKLSTINSLELNDAILSPKDLDDLKYFSNLIYLDITNSNLTNIDFLKNIPSVEYLNLSNNNISDISAVINLSKLKSINLSNNNVLDISVLKNLSDLEDITLDNNKIINYDDVFNNLDHLILLSLENCDITDLKLNENIEYEAINLSGNPRFNLVSKVKSIVLQLNNNNMTDFNKLENVDKERLQTLSVTNNDIKNISYLKNFSIINSINLSGNKNIENLNILKDIYNKEEQEEYENNDNIISTFLKGGIRLFTKKKTVGNPNLSTQHRLFLNDCNISDITIFNDYDIEVLSLASNNITSLDNFVNYNINKIDLSNNNLSNANVSKLFDYNISELYLSNNGIKNINFDNDTIVGNIYLLDLSDNDISDVSFLEKINGLYILSLENNINLKKFPALFEADFINLSNTGIDDSFVDEINVENIKFINLSNNKNIKNISTFLEKLYNKVYEKNEELMNKTAEENGAKIEYNDGDKMHYFTNEYINLEVLINEPLINIKPYTRLLHLYANYEYSISASSDGVINLGNYEYFDIFKIINDNRINNLHNIEIDKSLTKIKVLGPNSYIELGNKESESGLFRISFK